MKFDTLVKGVSNGELLNVTVTDCCIGSTSPRIEGCHHADREVKISWRSSHEVPMVDNPSVIGFGRVLSCVLYVPTFSWYDAVYTVLTMGMAHEGMVFRRDNPYTSGTVIFLQYVTSLRATSQPQ